MSTSLKIAWYGLAVFYIGGGINHFIKPDFYIGIMPDFFPAKNFLNIASGIAEIILGVLVLFPPTRKFACYGIIAMLISFFSVHITHLFQPPAIADGQYWLLVVRIPLQFLFIWWAWRVSKA